MKNGKSNTHFQRDKPCVDYIRIANQKKNCYELQLAKEKRGHFLFLLFCPKKTFVFYLRVQCIEYTFKILIHLHIKSNTLCLFLKSPKAYSVSLTQHQKSEKENSFKNVEGVFFHKFIRKLTNNKKKISRATDFSNLHLSGILNMEWTIKLCNNEGSKIP